ncbi:MAG TPA: O-antigen ligase family protein [Bacteroidales bacterium]|nr:O-antigen ligase family protein [Bacteroidales bacterium]
MNERALISTVPLAERRIGFYEYFFVLMLMLYAGRSIIFFESQLMTENPVGVLLPVVLSGILAFRWKLYFTPRFFLLLFFFFLYFLAVSLKYYDLRPTFILTYFFLFFIAYTTISVLKFNFFLIYEKILYYFAAVSLFIWGFQVLTGDDFLFGIILRIPFLEEISFVSGGGLSTIVYSIQPYATTLINEHIISRNCGFAWEPGSYSSYLALGIFINLFLAEKNKSTQNRFWVLLLAILSTMSTTGYVLLAIIMVFYLMNRDFRKVVLLFPVAALALILFFSLPFMKDKIVELVKEPESLDEMVYQAAGRERNITPQRFSSLIITLIDFKNNPFLGIAAHASESWVEQAGSSISPISGIGNLMAQFGLAGLIPFLIFSVRSSILFSRYFKYRGKFLLFLIIIGISISYTIIFIPFIMCFWLFSLFEPDFSEVIPERGSGSLIYQRQTKI